MATVKRMAASDGTEPYATLGDEEHRFRNARWPSASKCDIIGLRKTCSHNCSSGLKVSKQMHVDDGSKLRQVRIAPVVKAKSASIMHTGLTSREYADQK